MRKKIFLYSCVLLLFFSLVHSEAQKAEIDPETASKQLTKEVTEVIRVSGGDLYYLNNSGWARIMPSPSISICQGLEYWIVPELVSKKSHVSSTHEALEIFRKAYTDLLPKLNAIRNLRPYLAEFPITPNSFRLYISFAEKPQIRPPHPYFNSAASETVSRDPTLYVTLCQYIGWKKSIISPFQDVYRIPFDTIPDLAPLFFAKVERKPGPKNPWLLINTLPFSGIPTAQFVYEFVPHFCPQNNLHFITVDRIEKTPYSYSYFGFVLAGTHKLVLEEARQLAAKCGVQFLQHIQNASGEIKQSIIKWNKRRERPNPEASPGPRDFAFRLSFWDENIDRRESPYIAEVHMFDSKFQYFTADEGQRLVLVYEEPFDEAVAACLIFGPKQKETFSSG